MLSSSNLPYFISSLLFATVAIFFSHYTGVLDQLPSTLKLPLSTTSQSETMATVRRAAPLVFPAISRHTATVIFIHGLGDSGHGWGDAVEHWRSRQKLDEIKFILPHAPTMPITMVSTRWLCSYAFLQFWLIISLLIEPRVPYAWLV
jgi:hypothetical protein